MFSVENIRFDRWTRCGGVVEFFEKLKLTEAEMDTCDKKIQQIWSSVTSNQRRYYKIS